MSLVNLDLSIHDHYLSTVVISIIGRTGGRLVALDGGTYAPDLIAPAPNCYSGYRPDAIIEWGGNYVFIELKSGMDADSGHSRKQYCKLFDLVSNNDNFFASVFIFDGNGLFPESLRNFQSMTEKFSVELI